MSTNEITKHALIELDLMGLEVWRQNQIRVPGRSFVGKKGLSDIIGYARPQNKANYAAGTFCLCEVKGEGDRLKKEQITLLDDAYQSGCICFIATLDEKKKFILKKYQPE